MEIAYIAENVIRLKGKQVVLMTNALQVKNKTVSDGVLLTGTSHSPEFFKEDSGVVFQGPGEYEIKGTKVTGFASDGEVMYTVALDGVSIFVGNVTSALKMKDKLHEHNVCLLFANEILSQAVMGVLNASVLIFAGEKGAENAKAFDKPYETVSKFSVTKDSLPQETAFVFLA